jgi:rhodanese-related sulfurtransferase
VSVEGRTALLCRPLAMSTEPSKPSPVNAPLTSSTRLSPETISAMPVQERMVKLNWIGNMWRSDGGTPYLAADFIGRLGRGVLLVDVREAEELVGPQGHVPGSQWLPLERLLELPERHPEGTPVVLISRNGGPRAAEAARTLECAGMGYVAVMDGGVMAWKKLGFATVRDEAVLSRAPASASSPVPADSPVGPLTRAQIEAHIGDPHSVRWVKMAALLLHGKSSCVDGRDDHGVIGTPGGDAGEFMLALTSLERSTGKPFPVECMEALLRAYLDTFGHFYIHSDTHAGNNLIRAMRGDPRLAPHLPAVTSTPQDWRRFMSAPPEELWELICEHMMTPDNLGCGHLRLMMQHPARYMVRAELLEAFLRTYLRMRWGGAHELEYTTLGGGHQEGAVVNIRLERGVWPFTRVPLISPACGATQMFVNHPQISDFTREQVARFLTIHPDFLPVDEGHFGVLFKDMRRVAAAQLGATLAVLASGLPIFDVVFRNEREFTVTEVGVVGEVGPAAG